MSLKEFNEFMNDYTKAKVDFSPTINDKLFALVTEDGARDLEKYLKNI